MYEGLPLKVVMWLCTVSAVLNVMDRLQKENEVGKVKLLWFTVIVNIICAVDFSARTLATGIFSFVKIICNPIAVVTGVKFVVGELRKSSSIDNEYNSIKEPVRVLLTHMIVLPICMLLVQLVYMVVKSALYLLFIILVFAFAFKLTPLLGAFAGGMANPIVSGEIGARVASKEKAKKSAALAKSKEQFKSLERGLEGARRGESGYFHVDTKYTERKLQETSKEIRRLEKDL